MSLPQVELSFGASNGAWDDRALITACDAAMAEFHVSDMGHYLFLAQTLTIAGSSSWPWLVA